MSNKVSNCLTANRERVLSSLKSRYNILPHTFILDTLMEHRASSVAKTGSALVCQDLTDKDLLVCYRS